MFNNFTEKERAVLQARADRAARQLLTGKEDSTLTTLSVAVSSESYGLPIATVIAVYEQMLVVPVPCTPSFVAGIANIRGHILPVMDLGILLGAPTRETGLIASLVVISDGDLSIALRVDEIGAVQALATNSLAPLASNLDLAHTSYLKGMLPDGSILLDVNAILSDPVLVVNDPIT